MRPMWSITTGTGESFSSGVILTIIEGSTWSCRCQSSAASLLENFITSAIAGPPPRCWTKLKRTPRKPCSCSFFSSDMSALTGTSATPM